MLSLFLAGIFFHSCAPLRLPPTSVSPTGEHHVGKFVWFDLYTDDMKAVTLFYETLFNWRFKWESLGKNQVKTIYADNTPIATAVLSKPLNKRIKESRWLGFISSDNVDLTAASVEANMGSLIVRPKDQPDRGRAAVAQDREGAIFGLITATGGDPKDIWGMENLWMGAELWTSNVNSALNFYGAVAGYEPSRVDMGNKSDYIFLVKEGRPLAGVVDIPWKHIKPDWIPYILVSDAVGTAEKAVSLGGRVLVQPDRAVRSGGVAIIADPSGAVFGIQELQKTSREDQ